MHFQVRLVWYKAPKKDQFLTQCILGMMEKIFKLSTTSKRFFSLSDPSLIRFEALDILLPNALKSNQA